MTISLAIPTYNSSQYLWDCIRPAINNDFIGEIVINDDFSSPSEYFNIIEIAEKLNTDKIKVYKNSENKKAFVNKYITVSKCSYDWVYLFDSDNWFDENIIDLISKLDYTNIDTCFIGSKLLVTSGDIIKYDYDDKVLDLSKIKEYINTSTHHIDWFLNNGNFIVNKKKYLSTQSDFFNNPLYHGTADVLLFSYYWLSSGNKYEIVDGWYHHHRVRPGNYFMENGGWENLNVLKKYYNMLLDL